MKKRKPSLRPVVQRVVIDDTSSFEDIWEAEREFAELVSEHWEMITDNPNIHAKAMKTAVKLRELKSILVTAKKVRRRVN